MVTFIKRHKITAIILIYAIYISLGIPDSLLGVAWPSVRLDFNIPIYFGSIVMSIVAILAAISSVSYTYIQKRISIENVVVLSCFLTSIGLLLMGVSDSFAMLCIASVPLGVGAGAVDAALNNFVSENLSSKHMIWLHGSWGIGAIIGPFIYSLIQKNNYPWQYSAILISIIQIFLTIVFFIHKGKLREVQLGINVTTLPKIKCNRSNFIIRILSLFIFSGFDVSINLWMSTYLQEYLGYKPEIAGIAMSLYFGSVMIGRFVIGIVSEKLKIHKIIFYGIIISMIGVIVMITAPNEIVIFLALSLIGMGMCVVYPFTLFENHILFERNVAQKLTSYQIAVNLIGSLILPFFVGLLITYQSLSLYIVIQMIFLSVTFILRVYLNKHQKY